MTLFKKSMIWLDNPEFYIDYKLQYGVYEGWSEKLGCEITFEVKQDYWSGDYYSTAGIYDNSIITNIDKEVTDRIRWNPHIYIYPITKCKLKGETK